MKSVPNEEVREILLCFHLPLDVHLHLPTDTSSYLQRHICSYTLHLMVLIILSRFSCIAKVALVSACPFKSACLESETEADIGRLKL